jgi:hypothetical protein
MKHLILLSSLLFCFTSFGSEPELIVRADKYQPKGLPVWSKMPSMSPSCNDNGVAVKYLSLFGDEKLHPAVSFFQRNKVLQSDPLESDLSVSDPFITDDQSIVFALNYRGGTKGVFQLGSDDKIKQITTPADFPNVRAMSRPSLLDGKVLYRALTKDGLHTVYHGSDKLFEESGEIAYLYLPTVKKNQFVLKVGLGVPGEVSQENKDKIISINSGKRVTVAVDQDFDPSSDFLGFDNSPVPDGEGGVAFIADHKTHGRSLWLYKDNKLKMIFESSDEKGNLEYFSPSVNASGSLVFRVIKNKRISVLGWNHQTQSVEILMEQGQKVFTNEASIRVIDRERWPAFSGKPCIANSGEVYIHAVLEGSENFENKGSGIFKLQL